MSSLSQLSSSVLIALLFITLVAIAEAWARIGTASPEVTRKFVHISGGIVCLLFPFYISSSIIVLLLAIGMSATFWVGIKYNLLKCLNRVERNTQGTLYYPIAIYLVFLLSSNQTWLYVSSICVLAISDACAALVGTRYGSVRYMVEEESKSLEGSFAFLIATFLAVHLPLLLLSDLSRETCVLSALLVAFLVTGIEAVSLKGADNLLVPIGVCITLKKITIKPLFEILYQNLSLLAFGLIVGMMVYRFRSFNVGGAIVLLLFLFGTWSLGSEAWAFPILVASVVYILSGLYILRSVSLNKIVRVKLVANAILIPSALVVIANITSLYNFFYGPFLTASALVLMLILVTHLYATKDSKYRTLAVSIILALLCSATCLIPASFLQVELNTQALLIQIAIVCTGSILRHYLILRTASTGGQILNVWRNRENIAVILTGVFLCAIAQLAGIPTWEPKDIIGVELLSTYL